MSEPKNTAIAAARGFGYSLLTPAEHRPKQHLLPLPAMLTLALLLAALVLFTVWDSAEAHHN